MAYETIRIRLEDGPADLPPPGLICIGGTWLDPRDVRRINPNTDGTICSIAFYDGAELFLPLVNDIPMPCAFDAGLIVNAALGVAPAPAPDPQEPPV